MKIIKKSVKILFILMLVLAAGLAVLDIYLIKKPEMEAKRKIAVRRLPFAAGKTLAAEAYLA